MQWVAPQAASQKPESGDICDLLFLRFNRGPLGVLLFKLGIFTRGQLGLVDIISQYIHYDEVCEAISMLSSMNWDTLGRQCFVSMSAIVNHLLRQKLTPEREAQLEASLGTFYAPTRPLLDTTILEYRDQISKYARRFFHHLLRYQRFEKAFLLAVDIGARDLFMDIHYLALDKGELALAEVARKRARDIDAESITSGVELLGPLDRGDMLSEAFIGLSLTRQGEDTFPEHLSPFSSIHRHINQQRTLNVSSSRMPRRFTRKKNRQTIIHEDWLHTTAPANRKPGSLPPLPAQPQLTLQVFDRRNELEKDACAEPLMEGEIREDCIGQEIGDGGSLRMVHFGLV